MSLASLPMCSESKPGEHTDEDLHGVRHLGGALAFHKLTEESSEEALMGDLAFSVCLTLCGASMLILENNSYHPKDPLSARHGPEGISLTHQSSAQILG